MIQKSRTYLVSLLTLSVLLTSCASATKSTILGAVIGGVVGTAIGHNHGGGSDQGKIVGGAIGAGLGGLIGYGASQQKTKQTQNSPTLVKSEDNAFPPLTKPKLRSIWVPDRIEGNKYIKGHEIFVIEDAGGWSKE